LHASAAAGEGAPPAASAAAGEGASRRRLMTQINKALKSKLHAMSVSMMLLVARTSENFVRVCAALVLVAGSFFSDGSPLSTSLLLQQSN